MLGALTHAVVHVVAFRCNDPVVPLDILELDEELFLAAHADDVAATQRALPERVFGVIVAETHLGRQERLLGGVGGAVRGAKVLPALVAADFQTKSLLASVQKGLQVVGDGESVPVTLPDIQHLLRYQGTVGDGHPTFCRQKNAGSETGVSMAVFRGADVDPQRRLEYLDTLAVFLQKLEGKTKARCVTTPCLIYGSMAS